ncbi:MAG: hypothetical protein IPO27_01080 [Bacteroidetes bacterium]|nr:hypothetical protein [Bacteroidota bacterium]
MNTKANVTLLPVVNKNSAFFSEKGILKNSSDSCPLNFQPKTTARRLLVTLAFYLSSFFALVQKVTTVCG